MALTASKKVVHKAAKATGEFIGIKLAEDLDLVMPMCNLTEYSSNYSEKQKVYGFIQKMKILILQVLILILIMQKLLIIIILNLSSIRLNY